jgi:hypothetical protein
MTPISENNPRSLGPAAKPHSIIRLPRKFVEAIDEIKWQGVDVQKPLVMMSLAAG